MSSDPTRWHRERQQREELERLEARLERVATALAALPQRGWWQQHAVFAAVLAAVATVGGALITYMSKEYDRDLEERRFRHELAIDVAAQLGKAESLPEVEQRLHVLSVLKTAATGPETRDTLERIIGQEEERRGRLRERLAEAEAQAERSQERSQRASRAIADLENRLVGEAEGRREEAAARRSLSRRLERAEDERDKAEQRLAAARREEATLRGRRQQPPSLAEEELAAVVEFVEELARARSQPGAAPTVFRAGPRP